jgi:signal transduction histidine kinase
MANARSLSRARRTVGGRLLVSYLGMLAAFAITLGWSIHTMREAARDARLLRDAHVPLLSSIGEALAAQNVMNTQLNHITSARNPADVRQWIDTARRLRPLGFRRVREEAERGLPPSRDGPGLRELLVSEVERLERELGGDGPQFDQLFQALASGDGPRAEVLRDALVAREADGAQRLRALRQRVEAEMAALTEAAQQREERSILLLMALSALTLLVGLLTSVYARRVLRPLGAVTERARAVASGDLGPRAIVATGDEIGELAETFEEMVAAIRKARADLVHAERLATIGKMAAHITHEVRNPLSSISLNLELLEEELGGAGSREERVQLVAAIQREVERLSQIAEQYLSVVREPRLRLARESPEDLVRELVAFVRPELERAGIKCVLEVAPGLPKIDLDEAQLRQALLNLIRNAREAQPKGGEVAVRVAAEVGEVILCVEDDGPGVPAELAGSIFDPFYTTKQRGTGLGLAVTRSIVEAHGGTIRCEPREPRGTRMRLALPVP